MISAVIYPIEAHWIWGGGWLSQIRLPRFRRFLLRFIWLAVSAALIGASSLGPRIGKFVTDKNRKVTRVNAFLDITFQLAALGVFILWLGWYGFNGAAATTVEELGSIFVTHNNRTCDGNSCMYDFYMD